MKGKTTIFAPAIGCVLLTIVSCTTIPQIQEQIAGRWFGFDGGYGSYLDISPPQTVVLTIVGFRKSHGTYRVTVGKQGTTVELTFQKPDEELQFSAVLSEQGEFILTREGYPPIIFSRQPEAMFTGFRPKRHNE